MTHAIYPNVFQPLDIGPATVRNRIFVPAHTTNTRTPAWGASPIPWMATAPAPHPMTVAEINQVVKAHAETAAILAEGHADMVGMARAHIADPAIVNKAQHGQESSTVPCIGCNQGCAGMLAQSLAITCLTNPAAGLETQWPVLEKSQTTARHGFSDAVLLNELVDRQHNGLPDVTVVSAGDCQAPRTALEAVFEGHEAARTLGTGDSNDQT